MMSNRDKSQLIHDALKLKGWLKNRAAGELAASLINETLEESDRRQTESTEKISVLHISRTANSPNLTGGGGRDGNPGRSCLRKT